MDPVDDFDGSDLRTFLHKVQEGKSTKYNDIFYLAYYLMERF